MFKPVYSFGTSVHCFCICYTRMWVLFALQCACKDHSVKRSIPVVHLNGFHEDIELYTSIEWTLLPVGWDVPGPDTIESLQNRVKSPTEGAVPSALCLEEHHSADIVNPWSRALMCQCSMSGSALGLMRNDTLIPFIVSCVSKMSPGLHG